MFWRLNCHPVRGLGTDLGDVRFPRLLAPAASILRENTTAGALGEPRDYLIAPAEVQIVICFKSETCHSRTAKDDNRDTQTSEHRPPGRNNVSAIEPPCPERVFLEPHECDPTAGNHLQRITLFTRFFQAAVFRTDLQL